MAQDFILCPALFSLSLLRKTHFPSVPLEVSQNNKGRYYLIIKGILQDF